MYFYMYLVRYSDGVLLLWNAAKDLQHSLVYMKVVNSLVHHWYLQSALKSSNSHLVGYTRMLTTCVQQYTLNYNIHVFYLHAY